MPGTMGFYSQRAGGAPPAREWEYNGFPRGQNSYAEPNEVRDTEFYEGVNIELIGRASVRLPRRGHRLFANIPTRTTFNGWGIYKNPKTSVNLMVVLIDGHLYKINTAGTPTEIDGTKTWDGDAKMRGVLLREWFYFGNGVDYMAKTDGTTITRWSAITAVSSPTLSLTGTGADTLYGYAVTAVTDVGETEVSATVTSFGPGTLDNSNYFTFGWNRKTESNVTGYNIYKSVKGGTYLLLTFVDQAASGATMSFADKGISSTSLLYEAPSFNTTGGVKGNIYAKYANTLFLAGNVSEPDTVFYGGTGSNYESFSPNNNGGWIKPGRGDGDKVTAMIGFEDFLFIFKENSIWKFTFSGDGGPELTAVIPQYGTSSPDSVWRMEKDVAFLGSDGRYRILGYEPTQLNVIRTADISNRIQNKLDAIDKNNMQDLFGVFFEQKFIMCNRSVAYPYDRRYIAFLGEWNNYTFDRFIVWDQGNGQQKLYGAEIDTGNIQQLLVDETYDDNGSVIEASLRPKTIDGGRDKQLKYFRNSRIKFKDAKGIITLETYKDNVLYSSDEYQFGSADVGFEGFMWDEPMWDEGTTTEITTTSLELAKKNLDYEAYTLYHKILVNGGVYNHAVVQTMSGFFDFEDPDYERDEVVH